MSAKGGMRSVKEVYAMREDVRKARSRAVAPDDGPRSGEMRLELQLHGAEIALDWALGSRDCGKILMGWAREAERGEKPPPVDYDEGRAKD
jgi:hypothetical protein